MVRSEETSPSPDAKRKRVIALVILTMTVGAALGGSWLLRQRNLARFDDARHDGLVAFSQQDYEQAAEHLAFYFGRYRDDYDVVMAFAESRRILATRDGTDTTQAITLFRHASELNPESLEPLRALVGLYAARGYLSERSEVLGRILVLVPDDREALATQALTLEAMNQDDRALEVVRALIEFHPTDADAHALFVEMLSRTGTHQDAIIEHVEEVAARIPESTPLAVLEARVLLDGGYYDLAKAAAQRATGLPIARPDTVQSLAEVLDRLLEFDAADDLLTRAAADESIRSGVQVVAIERAWHRGRVDMARSFLPTGEFVDASIAPDLAGWHAFLVDPDLVDSAFDVNTIIDDPDIQFWKAILLGRHAVAEDDWPQALRHYEDAALRRPDHALATLLLGEAYRELGEIDRAATILYQLAHRRAALGSVHSAIAGIELQRGRLDDALQSARRATTLRSSLADGIRLAEVLARCYESGASASLTISREDAESLVDDLVDTAMTDGAASAVAARLAFALGDVTRAIDAIRATVATQEPLPPDVLIPLMQQCRDAGLILEAAALYEVSAVSTKYPEVIVVELTDLVAQGLIDDAIARIDAALVQAKSDDQRRRLEIVRCKFYDAWQPDLAADVLTKLAMTYPSSVDAQITLLTSTHGWSRLDEIEAAITRLRSLTGEGGLAWRLHHARHQLIVKRDTTTAGVVVESLLPPVILANPDEIDAYRLLADAWTVLDNDGGAIDALASVVSRPGGAFAYPDLIHRLLAASRSAQAEVRIDEFSRVKIDGSHTSLLRSRARLLLERGRARLAVTDLERIIATGEATLEDRVMLAESLQRDGRGSDAEILLLSLVEAGGDEAQIDALLVERIVLALARQRQFDASRDYLARWSHEVSETRALLLRALLQEQQYGTASARELYVSVLQDSLSADDLFFIAAYATRARDHDLTHEVRVRCDADPQARSDPRYAALAYADSLVRDAEVGSPAIDVATLGLGESHNSLSHLIEILQSEDTSTSFAEFNREIRALIADDPLFFMAYEIGARRALAEGRVDLALEYAEQAHAVFADQVAVLRLLTEMRLSGSQYKAAREAALAWQRTTDFDRYNADLTLAYIEEALGNVGIASGVIEPWRDRIIGNASERPDHAEFLLHVLVQTGRSEDARTIVEELERRDAVLTLDAKLRITFAAPDPITSGAWVDWCREGVDPADIESLVRIAAACFEMGRRESDELMFKRVVEILEPAQEAPAMTPSALMMLASTHEILNQHDEAMEVYRLVIRKDDDHPIALNNLAYLTMSGDPNDALELAQRAVKAGEVHGLPGAQHSQLLETLGVAMLTLGDPEPALEAFVKAVRMNSDNILARVGLAECYVRLDQIEDAARETRTIDRVIRGGAHLGDGGQARLDKVKAAIASRSGSLP